MKIYLIEELTGDVYEHDKSVIGCYSNLLTAVDKAKEYYNNVKIKLPYPEGFDENGNIIDESREYDEQLHFEYVRVFTKNLKSDILLDVYVSELEIDSNINENLTTLNDRISIEDLIKKEIE